MSTRQLKKVKAIPLVVALVLGGLLPSTYAEAADFINGGFETGDTSGWSIYGGLWQGSTPSLAPLDPFSSAWSLNSSNASVTVVNSTTTDTYITQYNAANNTNITPVFDGSNAVRVNNNANNFSVSVIRQSVTNYSASTIYVAWLAVLQGSHGPTDSDHFVIKVHDDTTNTDVASISYSSATTASFFTNLNGVYVSGWRADGINVTAGHDYTLALLASDCNAGGHWGYVYLDYMGANAPQGLTVNVAAPTAHDIVGSNELAANLGTTLNPRFDGGTLVLDGTSLGSTYTFTITSNNGTVDVSGNTATIDTVIANDSSAAGSLRVTNSGSGGVLTLTAINTYTGTTTIDSGATLALTGSGSIAASSGVIANGTFDISGTTTGTSIQALTGSGSVILGSKTLTITNALGIFSGVMSGTGGVNLTNGTQTLNGVNTYTGDTTINGGTLIVGDASNQSSAAIVSSTTVSSGGTLAGYGTVGATGTTLTNSGTVSPGNNSIATLSVGGAYVQNSGGNLLLGLTPTTNDLLAVAGTATLDGTLTVNGSSGTYTPTRYTLVTSSGRSGTFNTFSTDLSSYTTLGYFLSYDNNNVYLTLGPDYVNTTVSLNDNYEQIRSVFASESSALMNGLNYDCSLFGENNICLNLGGRISYVYNKLDGFDGHSPMTTSALLIGAYRVDPTLRVGAWVDQDLHTQGGNVKVSNSNPMFGIFGVYYPSGNNTEWQVKLAASYVDKNIDITRKQLLNTEPGHGKTSYQGVAALAELAYGFDRVVPDSVVSPFIGFKNVNGSMGAYAESASASVQVPVTYAKYSQWATMAYGGLKFDGNLDPKVKYSASVGVDTDIKHNDPSYSGTSNIYGLSSFNLAPSTAARHTRSFATLGFSYMLEKNESVYLGGSYRQDQFKGISSLSGMLIYTVGL
ncbi:hypothetical protein ICV01_07265 [Polynucleobacter sp. MWH-Spelu-300-X4]|uniref:autotransporter outer membrane beta-barrel domain-containing protein n=1 Tax=Polynucleobacter sp. MWH-Spelu-300-X4 TaxID=2689109 RepID=UPI001BFE1233|nr:autotransporter-associated beta strand repeat-containing protein [Polynucleobacter sp. MWH-Spelu-300-X4]QWD79435.1 hypothetical protein ICV01_07265 [Polynucleobacter sp. MWH-Spelu-300-X4]